MNNALFDPLYNRVIQSLHTIPGEEFHELLENAHRFKGMAGDDEDSWKSVLAKAGVECVPILKGTAEYDVFVEIWADHLARVLSHF